LNDCNNHGKCVNWKCTCDFGWEGIDCGVKKCKKECLNGGKCFNGECHCPQGYKGEYCQEEACLNDCSGKYLICYFEILNNIILFLLNLFIHNLFHIHN